MTDAATIPAKYIFLDVVDFTNDRSVEAQSDIVAYLNGIVSASVKDYSIPDETRIFLPTGDGLCIALLNIECLANTESAYDLHLRLALTILKRLDEQNATTEDPRRKFQIRIGINENTDNLVVDINGAKNIAGDGINLAQRIMSLADGNQILVSDSVIATLGVREKYMHSSFKKHPSTKIKHGKLLTVHQFVASGHSGLNVEIPQRFQQKAYVEPLLTELAAYYFAHAIAHREFLMSTGNPNLTEYPGVVLLHMLADDSVNQSNASAFNVFEPRTTRLGQNFEEQLKYLNSLDFWVVSNLKDYFVEKSLETYSSYFEEPGFGAPNYLFPTSAGEDKLRQEFPEIWKEFHFK